MQYQTITANNQISSIKHATGGAKLITGLVSMQVNMLDGSVFESGVTFKDTPLLTIKFYDGSQWEGTAEQLKEILV